MQEWSTIADALLWAGFKESPSEPDTAPYTLLEHLGYSAEDNISDLGTVPAADLADELATWTIGDARPSLALRNRARQAAHAARVFIGVDWALAQTQEYEKAELEHKRELEWFTAQQQHAASAAQSAPPTQSAPTSTAPPGRTVNFKDIADGARNDDISVLTVPAMDAMREHYITVTHNRHGPPDNCEPTAEQMAALHTLLREGNTPYVDFAIWSPFRSRTQRKINSTGLMFGANGVLQKLEFRGPPSFEHWKACWKVYETAMIYIDAVDPPVMHAYCQYIEDFARQFGHACWALLYQVESRFRREFIEKFKRREAKAQRDAVAVGAPHPFDPARPWQHMYDIAINEFHWWHSKVTVPCWMVTSKARSLGHFIDGDCEFSASATQHIATALQHDICPSLEGSASSSGVGGGGGAGGGGGEMGGGDNNKRPGAGGKPPPLKKVKTEQLEKIRMHNVTNGMFTTNRSGRQLCEAFQNGKCSGPCPEGAAHQCAKCLDPHHGAFHPQACKKQPGPAPKGKGRGKGK